jgi:vacuolar-type H+-ATPase subunit I/STV1
MPSKKMSLSSTVGIIHLSNSYLTYIRNLREKQNYVYVIPPLENLYQESFSLLYLFFHPPTWLGHVDANPD